MDNRTKIISYQSLLLSPTNQTPITAIWITNSTSSPTTSGTHSMASLPTIISSPSLTPFPLPPSPSCPTPLPSPRLESTGKKPLQRIGSMLVFQESRKKKVKVEVEEGNILQISSERTRENKEKIDTWHRVERSSRNFVRRFRLPENAKGGQEA